MEAPGTAPGSEWFITITVYRHIQNKSGNFNICNQKGKLKPYIANWLRERLFPAALACFAFLVFLAFVLLQQLGERLVCHLEIHSGRLGDALFQIGIDDGWPQLPQIVIDRGVGNLLVANWFRGAVEAVIIPVDPQVPVLIKGRKLGSQLFPVSDHTRWWRIMP